MAIEVSWQPFEPAKEADLLASFLSSHDWPYHGTVRPAPEKATEWVRSGRFGNGPDARGFWGRVDGKEAAFLAIEELEDPTPVFDLRIAAGWRRCGIGRSALQFLADWTFGTGDKHRVEAHTRVDNEAMRELLRAEGWVQEAHYRQAWPDGTGVWHDAVTYALLRDDHRRGSRTPRPPLDD